MLRTAQFQVSLDPAPFHIFYDPARLHIAVAVVAAFALVSVAFCFARFSFGYAVGFYFYTMISGYLWLNCFTDLNYDHRIVGDFRGRIGGDVSSSRAVHRIADPSGIHDVGRCVRPAADGDSAAGCRGGHRGRALQFSHCRHCGHLRFPRQDGIAGNRQLFDQRLPRARCCPLHSPALLSARLIGRRAPPCCCCC